MDRGPDWRGVRGGAEAVADLARMITEAGFVVEYDPPMEYRDGLEHEAVHVLLFVLEKVGGGGLGGRWSNGRQGGR